MKTSTAILTGIGAALMIDAADASEPAVSDYCMTMGELAHKVAIDRDRGMPASEIITIVLKHADQYDIDPYGPLALDWLTVVDNTYVTPHLRPSVEQVAAYEQCLADKGAL